VSDCLLAEQVAAVRHELRTPVNALTGYAELLLEDHAADGELAEAMATVLEEMRGVLREILRFLPAATTDLGWAEVDAGIAGLVPRRQVVQAALARASRAPSSVRPEVAEDLARMRLAAGQLGVVDRPASGTPPPLVPAEAESGTEVVDVPADILVVDDVADNRLVLARRLGRLGHRVVQAASGDEALAVVATQAFDLILLDGRMPGRDGFEVLVALKGAPATAEIPVVMISALDDFAQTARCIAAGAEDYLAKPFDVPLLRARVGATLERKRLRDRERDLLEQTRRVTEAALAVERDTYDAVMLAEVARRDDAVGLLARVFDTMASGVRAREEQLRLRLEALRGEIAATVEGSAAEATGAPTARLSRALARPSLALPGARALQVGMRLAGRYEIFDVVGQGGMGRVYRATDTVVGGEVAIKTLRPSVLAADAELREWFKREVRLSRRITHPNIVRTHDYGDDDGLLFITMEYVTGVSLRSLLASRRRLSVESTLAIGVQLCRALAAAHAEGVVHRDVKPDNVLLSADGVVKVMDFGIAQLVADEGDGTTDGAGTLGYSAPEQLLSEPVGPAADLYATGVLFYECLTGRLPYPSMSPMLLLQQVFRDPAPDVRAIVPEVSPAFAALIGTLLAPDPAARPEGAGPVAAALAAMR
jgi:CheY-like chemotaxis protein